VTAALTAAHALTHVGLSWIVANLARLSLHDRTIVVLAGTLLDLDGAGIVWSERAYTAAHRAAGHGVLFAALVVLFAVLRADRPRVTAPLAALSFHLHLLVDALGTAGLPIRYFWPLSDRAVSWDAHWVLASWPNVALMTAVALGILAIAWRRRRASTPAASRE
jgi:hypothetical protein